MRLRSLTLGFPPSLMNPGPDLDTDPDLDATGCASVAN